METPEKKASALEQEVPLTEMSIQDIKAQIKKTEDGELIKLPLSGMVFRLGKPSISRLLKKNAIPAELVVQAIALDGDSFEPSSKDEYLKALDVIDTVVCEAGIIPKIVKTQEEVDDNSIWLDSLDDQDRIAIYLYAQTGVRPELTKFRKDEQDGNAGSDLPKVPEPQA